MKIQQIIFGSDYYFQTLKIRDLVLRKPLGLQLTPADTATDPQDIYFAILIDEQSQNNAGQEEVGQDKLAQKQPDQAKQVIGCLGLTVTDDPHILRMKQVAIHPQYQKQGLGIQLVTTAEAYAKQNHVHEITLRARVEVMEFYQKLGYQPYGVVFESVSLPHLNMKKKL